MCGILQENVYKTRITDLDLLTMPMTNGCCNDDMIQLGPFRSHLLFPFVQISECYVFCTPSFAVMP